jgi:hypothetical protein
MTRAHQPQALSIAIYKLACSTRIVFPQQARAGLSRQCDTERARLEYNRGAAYRIDTGQEQGIIYLNSTSVAVRLAIVCRP